MSDVKDVTMHIFKLTFVLVYALFSAKVIWGVAMQCLMDTPDMSHVWWIASYFVFTLFAMTAPEHQISENDSAEKEKEIKRLENKVVGLQTFKDEFEKAMRNEVQKLKQRHEDEKDKLKKKLHAEKFLRLIDAAQKLKDIDSSPNPLALFYH